MGSYRSFDELLKNNVEIGQITMIPTPGLCNDSTSTKPENMSLEGGANMANFTKAGRCEQSDFSVFPSAQRSSSAVSTIRMQPQHGSQVGDVASSVPSNMAPLQSHMPSMRQSQNLFIDPRGPIAYSSMGINSANLTIPSLSQMWILKRQQALRNMSNPSMLQSRRHFAEPSSSVVQSRSHFSESSRSMVQSRSHFAEPCRAVLQSRNHFAEPSRAVVQSQSHFPEPFRFMVQSQSHFAKPSPSMVQSLSHFAEPSPSTVQSRSHFAKPSPSVVQSLSPFAEPSPSMMQSRSHFAEPSRLRVQSHFAEPSLSTVQSGNQMGGLNCLSGGANMGRLINLGCGGQVNMVRTPSQQRISVASGTSMQLPQYGRQASSIPVNVSLKPSTSANQISLQSKMPAMESQQAHWNLHKQSMVQSRSIQPTPTTNCNVLRCVNGSAVAGSSSKPSADPGDVEMLLAHKNYSSKPVFQKEGRRLFLHCPYAVSNCSPQESGLQSNAGTSMHTKENRKRSASDIPEEMQPFLKRGKTYQPSPSTSAVAASSVLASESPIATYDPGKLQDLRQWPALPELWTSIMDVNNEKSVLHLPINTTNNDSGNNATNNLPESDSGNVQTHEENPNNGSDTMNMECENFGNFLDLTLGSTSLSKWVPNFTEEIGPPCESKSKVIDMESSELPEHECGSAMQPESPKTSDAYLVDFFARQQIGGQICSLNQCDDEDWRKRKDHTVVENSSQLCLNNAEDNLLESDCDNLQAQEENPCNGCNRMNIQCKSIGDNNLHNIFSSSSSSNCAPELAEESGPHCESKLKEGDCSNAIMQPESPKMVGASLVDFFTKEQIESHLFSLKQNVGQDCQKSTEHSASENTCSLCGEENLSFAPQPVYCSSCAACIRQNAVYYSTPEENGPNHHFCSTCYRISRQTIKLNDATVLKSTLIKKTNDGGADEMWVQCDTCKSWQHQVCALFNDKKNGEEKAEYSCPNCCLEKLRNIDNCVSILPPRANYAAKDLPRTILGDHLEQRIYRRLEQERQERAKLDNVPFNEVRAPEDLVVRVVSAVDKKLEVKPRILDWVHDENYTAEFPYKSKVISLFQKIDGADICLFVMYVQEFGSECELPSQRSVYISYLDSVKYFRSQMKSTTGEALRTIVYHELLIGYLEYCKQRGFATCYLWSSPPPKGEDYILNCHPEDQKTPKPLQLRQWYQNMLKKAVKEKIVVDLTNLYDNFFVCNEEFNTKVTAARLPHFDGDYWSGAAEEILKTLEQESSQELRKKLKKSHRSLRTMGLENYSDTAIKNILLMEKLGEIIMPVKEDFFVIHLHHVCKNCNEVILSGSRWICNQCKDFHLCGRCYDVNKTCNKGDIICKKSHVLTQVMADPVRFYTTDEDPTFNYGLFEDRVAFLKFCQKNHNQFDSLRRAKHASMMILYYLHNNLT